MPEDKFYYLPLADCLERFRAAHAADPEALDVAVRSQHEIELYRKYPEHFGYVFFVMTPDMHGGHDGAV